MAPTAPENRPTSRRRSSSDAARRHPCLRSGLRWACLVPALFSGPQPRAEVVLPPLPSVHHLVADGASALHSVVWPAELPFGVGLARIEFDLAFTTTEVATPGIFLDAVSLSFRPPGTADTALLFTADASGTFWFPENPGGLEFPRTGLRADRVPFPSALATPGTFWASFAVTLTLPLAWQNCEAGVGLDLFDNRSGPTSEAWLHHIRLVAREEFFLLESSASPTGPYAAEMGVTRDTARDRFELPLGGTARFFRLRADSTVRLRVLARDPETWRFAYEFPEPQPRLESAIRPDGPYAPESAARLEPGSRRFVLSNPTASTRFFRIRANVRTAITRIESDSGSTRVTFEYRPKVFGLQSSAQPCGPYADDPSARFDTEKQEISLPRSRHIRMFRIAHSTAAQTVRLRPVVTDGILWKIPYEIVAAPAPSAQGNPSPEVQP